MRKIHYRPKANNKSENKHIAGDAYNQEKILEEKEMADVSIKHTIGQAQKLEPVKAIGDLECAYHFYLEDYVYTYLYQYAQADLSKESSALFVGKFYEESQEAVITGVIPIPMESVTGENEWISEEIIEQLEKEKEDYFKGEDIIGWMHMQPGYGTMLTMKELREHRAALGDKGRVFMLLDPINKVETLFAYENGELLEQSGYYMYYQRNEDMQRYMINHPFQKKEAEIIEDSVVNQFREIGKMRKQEYMQRKNVNITVVAASILLIALTAVIVKMNDSRNAKAYEEAMTGINAVQTVTGDSKEALSPDGVQFTINATDNKEIEGEGTKPEANMEQPEGIMQSNVSEDNAVLGEGKETEVSPVEVKLGEVETNGTGTTGNGENENENAQVEKEGEVAVADKSEIVEEEIEAKQYDTYVIKEGDTLANIIFNKYGSTRKAKEIAELNELGDTNYIKVGQSLKLPKN